MMAGRCISAGHIAESSLRIQQTCMATGEAAGLASALSIDSGKTPKNLNGEKVASILQNERNKVKSPFPILKNVQKNKEELK